MRCNEPGDLAVSLSRAVDDEGHEKQGVRQVFGVEVEDEKVDLASGIVLGESIRVCESKGG